MASDKQQLLIRLDDLIEIADNKEVKLLARIIRDEIKLISENTGFNKK